MYRFVGVTKVYGQGEQAVTALKDFNFTFPQRGMVCIVGESGCGKTTLLNILGGMDSHTEGQFFIDEVDSKQMTPQEWDRYRNTTVGFVFQDFFVFDEMTAADNVSLPLAICSVAEEAVQERTKQALEKVGLADQIHRQVGKQSGGQKQRVAIARAIVKHPRVLLADEPTGNLDSENSDFIFRLLKEIAETTLVIVVTHDKKMAEMYSDICITLEDGSIAKVTRPRENQETQVPSKSVTNVEPDRAQELPSKKARIYANQILAKRVWRRRITTGAFLIGIFLFLLTLALINFDENRAVRAYLSSYKGDAAVQKQREEFLSGEYSVAISVSKQSISFLEKIAGKEEVFRQWNQVTLSNSEMGDAIMIPTGETEEFEIPETISLDVTVRVLAPESLRKRALVETREDALVVTDYVASKMGMTKEDIGKEFYLHGLPVVLTAILTTDYESVERALAKDWALGEDITEQHYNVVYVSDSFLQRLADDAYNDQFYLYGAYFFHQALFPYMYSGFDVIGSNFLEEEIPVEDSIVRLACGRMPGAANEVLISWGLAQQEGILSEDGEFTEKSYEIKDIHSEEYKGNYEDRLNLSEFLGTRVTVVGVMDCGGEKIAVCESQYKAMLDSYYNLYACSCLGLLEGVSTKYIKELHEAKFRFSDSCLEPVYGIVDSRPVLMPYLVALLVLLLLLVAFMMVSHIRYGIKDNYRNIGILRALGVTVRDIQRMFLREPRNMTRISALCGSILCLLTIWIVNLSIEALMGARPYALLHFHALPLCIALVLLYAFALLLAWLPIKAAHKRTIIGVIKE